MLQRYGFFLILLFLTIFLFQAPVVKSQSNYQTPYNLKQSTPFYNSVQTNNLYENRENILIILDSSYSMNDKINGEKKIDIAKRVINQVLSQTSGNSYIGLRIYGHKMGILGLNACRASELKVPIGHNNQTIIRNILMGIKPVGMTPISYSIQQAVDQDFIGLQGKKRIILVSDGMETCDGSPCDYALELVKKGVDLKIDAIGFDLSEPEAVSQLKCTSLATKGKFYSARDANELTDSLNKSLNVNKEVEGKILKGKF
ncbi:MAG: VWA domain-containing protein [Candidatus Gastranaerophilales bacterium]|nr:VWA domain-containing protein [Candidatus Gastranaerophilales bacterium]